MLHVKFRYCEEGTKFETKWKIFIKFIFRILGSIQVTLKTRENMPSYVKREFEVYNSRVEEEVTLTHFAYSGWGDAPQRPRSPNPGLGSPEMPANTTGLLDLVEHALAHKVEASLPGPIAVHCR